MQEMYIISFNSTHHAMRLDKILNEKNIKSTTLPTPREISASCGISIRFDYKELDNINIVLNDNVVDYKGIFKISKNIDGKRNIEILG